MRRSIPTRSLPCCCLQDYLALQASLADALRSGFLSLAQARYSMGPDRVSALQFPSVMTATARLRDTGDGELALAQGPPAKSATSSEAESAEPSPVSSASNSGWARAEAPPTAHAGAVRGTGHSSTSGGAGARAGAPAAAASASSSDSGAQSREAAAPAPAAEDAAVEEQLQRLRLAAEQSGGILQQLAAKYGCEGGGPGGSTSSGAGSVALDSNCGGQGGGGGEDDDEYADVAPPGRPLSWFGSLVAPSLREAEANFSEALALVVQAANAQRRLRRGLGGWQAVGTAAGGASAEPSQA
ncbi:hypothetical protein ABPG75_010827 [Micractinium tetrahymenae]